MRGMNLCISLNIPHRFYRDDVHLYYMAHTQNAQINAA